MYKIMSLPSTMFCQSTKYMYDSEESLDSSMDFNDSRLPLGNVHSNSNSLQSGVLNLFFATYPFIEPRCVAYPKKMFCFFFSQLKSFFSDQVNKS